MPVRDRLLVSHYPNRIVHQAIMAIMKLKHALSCFSLVCAAFAIQILSEEQRRDPAVWETIQQPLHDDDVSILANINIPTADVVCPMGKT